MPQHPIKISIIVTTYNWPYALQAVLSALNAQTTPCEYEVIVADDGSREDTAKLIKGLISRMKVPLKHIWQQDDGFRASAARNKALLAATGDYIIFLDGDCIPQQDFVERHFRLAEPGYFVVGNRILLTRFFTLKVLSEALPIHQWSFAQWFWVWCRGYCNRISSLLRLPMGTLRRAFPRRWRGAKGCNLAAWKTDLLRINGWEEQFIGWGYEDSDLVIRLIQSGIFRKEGRYQTPVIHLWHPEQDRARERENWVLLKTRQQRVSFISEKGLNQYEF